MRGKAGMCGNSAAEMPVTFASEGDDCHSWSESCG